MYIFVKTLLGKAITLNVDGSDTIKNIKDKIFETLNIAQKEQLIIHNNKQLYDEETVDECNLCENITITLIKNFGDTTITISVINNNKHVANIKATLCDTIKRIKKYICEQTLIDPTKYILVYDGNSMNDNSLLKNYGISKDVIMYIKEN